MAEYIDDRRVGNTTRIIDELVQRFFKEGILSVWDHYHGDRRDKAIFDQAVVDNVRKMSMRIVLMRLKLEHGLEERVDLEVNHRYHIIKRINHG